MKIIIYTVLLLSGLFIQLPANADTKSNAQKPYFSVQIDNNGSQQIEKMHIKYNDKVIKQPAGTGVIYLMKGKRVKVIIQQKPLSPFQAVIKKGDHIICKFSSAGINDKTNCVVNTIPE